MVETNTNSYDNLVIESDVAMEVTIVGVEVAVGDVLGKITASGKYVVVDSTAVDGSAVARCVALEACDATVEDVAIPALFAGKVNENELSFGGTDDLTTHFEHLCDAGIFAMPVLDP